MPDTALHVGIDATCWSNDRGFGRFTRELVKALAQRGSGIRYSLVFDEAPATPVPAGVEMMFAGAGDSLREQSAGTARRSADYLFRLGRLASRADFDVFFFPAVYSYFPFLSRTPCVICYHDTIAERFPDLIFPTRRNFRLWRIKTAMSKLQARRAMTVSEASAREIEVVLKIPRAKIDVITEGPDPAFRILDDPAAVEAARGQLNIPRGAPLLVYVGGFNRHKNLTGLLRAMPGVLAVHPDIHLAIVGDTSGEGFWDNLPELRGLVRADPLLEKAVTFTGYLPDDVLVRLLNGASALVLPSLAEGFGLPAVEAMACGVPVLASDRGSLPEVVGDAGLLFDPEDPDDIAACLTGFFTDPGLQSRLAAKARERIALFTWARAAELAEMSFRRCAMNTRRSTQQGSV
ncbi:MAG: glycosyltransferase family 1 protein [Alphaproteobacteria bacterium]|nr:glycosyltransferase family 1 protein [Alphaproteobacteria bacterium]